MKFKSLFEVIPETWEIEFKNRDTAHKIYNDVKSKYNDDLGPITVNNDTWYIGTKLSDEEFKKGIVEFLDQFDIEQSQYSVDKTEVGKFWSPL